MRRDDIDLYDLLHAARRNAIWSQQGQNSPTTNLHCGTTQHLIEQAMAILTNRESCIPSKPTHRQEDPS